jgi:hypothetical protein
LSKLARDKAFAVLFLIVGAALWWTIGKHFGFTVYAVAYLLAAAALCAIPFTRTRTARALDLLRDPSPRTRAWTALGIAIAATGFILLIGFLSRRDMSPRWHDEFMYLLQMHHLAHFRLWYPQHPVADSFETFHIFVKPVYASIYFPGTALLYVPAVWLHLPYWLAPAIVAGASVGLMYRVAAEWIDGVAGWLAAILLLGGSQFMYLSVMVMAHMVMVLLGLLMLWAYLHFRRNPAHPLKWAALIGLFAGWAAITRPVDALCYAIPIGIAMLLDVRRFPLKRILATFALLVLAAAPLLALQVIDNYGITGNPLKTPYRLYVDTFMPGGAFGFHKFNPALRPATDLPQRQIYFDRLYVPALRAHRPRNFLHEQWRERLPAVVDATLANPLLLLLMPLSVMALERRRWVAWLPLPLFVLFYAPFAFMLVHYPLVVAPVAALAVVMGKMVVESLTPRFVSTFLTLAVAGVAFSGYPSLKLAPKGHGYSRRDAVAFAAHVLPKRVKEPAIVLFHFRKGDRVGNEPVYNSTVAWPDDARIIRAQDRGDVINGKLFQYYAKIQPYRTVYFYNRRLGTLTYLGKVTDLAAKAAKAAKTAKSAKTPASRARHRHRVPAPAAAPAPASTAP